VLLLSLDPELEPHGEHLAVLLLFGGLAAHQILPVGLRAARIRPVEPLAVAEDRAALRKRSREVPAGDKQVQGEEVLAAQCVELLDAEFLG